MKTILEKIVSEKKKEVKKAKQVISLKELSGKIKKQKIACRDFKKNISSPGQINFIGELKKASPIKGMLRENLDLAKTARIYERQGIKAISVLTDIHFCGQLSDIKTVKKASKLPVLRKDFIIDEYQLYESRLAGADAILLIAAILSKASLTKMLRITHTLGMHALVEVHNKDDFKKVNFKETDILGVNNRNLKNFKVDITTTEKLIKNIPGDKIVVGESGISLRKHVRYMEKLGVQALLIGEGIVRSKNIASKIKTLYGRRKS
ncbi:MAG: indole-3-glycerol phosphate synthase TrpC [PVC group bacterium]|nr:indole-3-glycerol phosphate synthase TrpC [PVC group bacterium]